MTYERKKAIFKSKIVDGPEAHISPTKLARATVNMTDALREDTLGNAPGTITSELIAKGAVNAEHISESAVTQSSLATDAVTTESIANRAVTAEKITDGAVTSAKLSNTGITAGSYERANLTIGEDGRVTSASGDSQEPVKFQFNGSSRAEIGLIGNEDLRFKVSADGTNWIDAMRIDSSTGCVSANFIDSLQLIIDYDAVATIQPPSAGGMMFLSVVHTTYPQHPSASILCYDVGNSPDLLSMILGSQVENLGTTTLNGTTGTDGKISLAVDGNGNLYIENRYQAQAWQFCLTFINGYRAL